MPGRFATRRARHGLACIAAALLTASCGDGRDCAQAIAVLVDTSGTYAAESREVARMLKREVLPQLVPGDTLLVIAIDDSSYEQDNLVSLVTLDPRPSKANAQKLALAQQLDAFAAKTTGSAFTDIPGAMMLAAEYLRETGSGSQVMLVFSDLQEDLPVGAQRALRNDEFDGIRIVAMNVKRLERDAANPENYRGRVSDWERRVVESGGVEWKTILDASKLPDYLAQVR